MRAVGASQRSKDVNIRYLLAGLTLSVASVKESQAGAKAAQLLGEPTFELLKDMGKSHEQTRILMRIPEKKGITRLWLDDSSVLGVLYGAETGFKPSLAFTSWDAINRYVDSCLHEDCSGIGVWVLKQYLEDYKERISKLEQGDKWTNWEWSDVMEFHQTLSSAVDIPALLKLRFAKAWTPSEVDDEEKSSSENYSDKSTEQIQAKLKVHEEAASLVINELRQRCQILENLIGARNSDKFVKNHLRSVAESLIEASNQSLAPIFGKKSPKNLKLGLANVCDTAYKCSGSDFLHYAGIKHADVIARKFGMKQPVCFLSGLIVDKDANKIYENPVLFSMFNIMYRNPRICSTVFKHMRKYGVPSSCASMLWGVLEPSFNWYSLGAESVGKMRQLWMRAWINYATARAFKALKDELERSTAVTAAQIRNFANQIPKIDGRSTVLADRLLREYKRLVSSEQVGKSSLRSKHRKSELKKLQAKVASEVDQAIREDEKSVYSNVYYRPRINFNDNINFAENFYEDGDLMSEPLYDSIGANSETSTLQPEAEGPRYEDNLYDSVEGRSNRYDSVNVSCSLYDLAEGRSSVYDSIEARSNPYVSVEGASIETRSNPYVLVGDASIEARSNPHVLAEGASNLYEDIEYGPEYEHVYETIDYGTLTSDHQPRQSVANDFDQLISSTVDEMISEMPAGGVSEESIVRAS